MPTYSTSSGPERGAIDLARLPLQALPPLPYAENALEPAISAMTLSFHHGRHHRGYVDALNKLIARTRYAEMPLEAIIADAATHKDQAAVYRNAAQHWNHSFYWKCLRPGGGGEPPPALARLIVGSFGSVEACKRALAGAAVAQFGSGWAWLVADGAKLRVVKTAGADCPSLAGMTPLLTIDVWEHAYYLDHQHRRGVYVDAVLDSLVDWGFAAQNAGVA